MWNSMENAKKKERNEWMKILRKVNKNFKGGLNVNAILPHFTLL